MTTLNREQLEEQAAQYRAEAEQAKKRQEFEFAFILLDTAENLERKAQRL